MTQRERQASGGVAAADPPASVQQAPRHSDPPIAKAGGRLPLWEDVYQNASPAQRRELLALASRQGLLYSHQLPAPSDNGAERGRQFLSRLLAGRVDGLEDFTPKSVAVGDADLDVVQREAVARALHTPDICLIEGLPGTGKSRVVAEIVAQAAAQGERVLLLAPSVTALDRVLEFLAGRESVCPVRCLGRDEARESLPPTIRALLFDEQVRSLRETTVARGRAEAEAAEMRCARRRQEAPLWNSLSEVAERHARLLEQQTALEDALARLPLQVEEEAARVERGEGELPHGSRLAALRHLVAERDEATAGLDLREKDRAARQTARENEGQTLADELGTLRPLADAKRQGRWWTGAWWRATLQGTATTRTDEIELQLEKIHLLLAELGQEQEALTAEKQRIADKFQAERSRLIEAEAARRRAEIADQQAAALEERRLLEDKGQSLARALGGQVGEQFLDVAAVAAAHGTWHKLTQQDEEQAAFAHHWVRCLEELGDSLPDRLHGYVNVVAATTGSLALDPHYGDNSVHGRPFDLLVMEEADTITEAEFTAAARRARRWVLVGEPESSPPSCEEVETPPRDESRRSNAGRGRGPARPRSRVAPLRTAFFHRLWQQLHCDPRRLPYAWVQENDRLCCRLRPVSPDQRRWVETESVADRPDVELRILSVPRHPPQLAEVVFPPGMSLCQAKEYIYRELQELPIRTSGHSLRWVEEPDRIVLLLADAPLSGTLAVALEPGVREMIGHLPVLGGPENGRAANGPPPAQAWQTCCVEFERAAGWQRERAGRWIEDRLALRDLGRTVRLDRTHRMRPELAACVADLLWGETTAAASGSGGAAETGMAVEFVPVPPLPRPRSEHSRGRYEPARQPEASPTGPVLPRSGAGIELDIADGRHRERLPAELRAALPERGLANYLEAQAILRALRSVLESPNARKPGSVGVVALYPSQAELIRRLIAQDAALRQADIAVATPSAFRQREFDTVLVSLTRSHSHRAVAFGEGPHALVQALTRARTRLILFGDVGGVVRRAQWDGPVDHLDEAAGVRERDILRRLVRYFQGHGARALGFRLHEGSSP